MIRNRQFRQNSFLFLLPALVVFILAGCQKPSINFGTTFSNDNSTNVVAVDTFSVAMSTVLVDSFVTAGSGRLLIGRYKDPYFGTITSSSVLQVTPPTNLPVISNIAQYDSLSLILRINKTFYGDTNVVQRYVVSQLNSLIQLPLLQTTFYNNSKVGYDPTPLGYSNVQINPTAFVTSQKIKDTVKIKLPDAMGHELYRLLFNQSDTLKSTNTFLGYFRGFRIYPDDNTVGGIFGFRDSVIMRVYYHEPGLVYTPKFIDFNLNNRAYQFNQITYDRSGTPISSIDSLHTEVASTATGNAAYIQPATGLMAKLKFPTIANLLQYQDYLSLLQATLTIKPVDGTYSPIYALPPQLIFASTNQSNIIGPSLPLGFGNLRVDYLYGANTSYTYDITSYIKQQITLGAENNNKNALFMVVPAGGGDTAFYRAVIGDQFNQKNINKVVLKLYYASFY